MQLKIETKYGTLKAKIDESKNPKTAKAVWQTLPIKARANRWGDEIYFTIPVEVEEENPQQEVEVGDIAYWPPGNAFCIFFGKTPVSTSNKPKAYSPVNVFAKIVEGNIENLKQVKDGDEVRIEKI